MNSLHILRPAAVAECDYERFFDGEDDERHYYWHRNTVRMITSRRIPRRDDSLPNIFAGLIKCADCGKTMILTRTHRSTKGRELIDRYIYMCNSYRTSGSKECSRHWLEAQDLYEAEQASLQKRIDEIESGLAEKVEKKDNIRQYTSLIKEYAGIKELNAALLNRLIDKITVTEPKEIDGESVQEIRIYYRFIGNIS